MKHRRINAWFVACLSVSVLFACNSTDRYIGTYQAIDTIGETRKENVIELMENGEGSWSCRDGGEVLFTWYVKGNELRINTKEGGIIVGKLENKSFTVALPGQKTLSFFQIPPQE